MGGNRGAAMRVIVIRHHAEDSPGFISAAFEARGARISTHLFPEQGPLPATDGADHVVVLGAIPSVYDDGPARAWIAEELAWLRRADEAGVPVLGICFGAQALCAALGGRVVVAARKEIGWTVIDSYDPDLIPVGPWLQFHGDKCLPSPQAKILARNEVGVQAFSIGRHLAVQFHPEVDGPQLRRWLDAGARAEAERAGQDPGALLAETVMQEPAARARADALVAAAVLLAQG
jgi:GMP synthase-like glutamine amidotransferase